ncbi:MAG: amino acid ABC transporter substrate-binding protein [Candidatus Rokubacteria bacterium]|nr:amino acid ABC transporter substrate-binding protein [Candidatus Rokubacteria bacterium]
MRRTCSAVSASCVAIALWIGLWATADAQPPIRIGASLSQSGAYAALSQNQVGRGYPLCLKHTNEQGGVLGRKLELVLEDDQSQPSTAARIYEKLITQDKVDFVLGPYGSPMTATVAEVVEKHRMPMVANAATTSLFKKGRRFIFMVPPPGEVFLEGLIDMAAKKGLKTVAVIHEDTLFATTAAQGAVELARKKGLEVVLVQSYSKGTADFTGLLTKVRAATPDVLAAGSYLEDAVAITRQLRELNVNPKMYGVTIGGAQPKFYEALGRIAEFVYGNSAWEPELVTLRAGGLIPVARQYPGAREFVEAHKKEYPGADLSYTTAAGYGGCQVLMEAVKRAGSLDREKVRDAILKLDFNTVYGPFKVDPDGLQIGHKMLTLQWQDGKKVIVWPDELAPGKPRFPTPPWNQRQ